MTALTHLHIYGNACGEPHPEELPKYRIRLDCESLTGVIDCMGAAAMGPGHCTCETLTDEDHARCLADAHAAHAARNGDMCRDCAFRKGSPENDELEKIAASEVPFRCHQGAPVDARGGTPIKDAYCPRAVKGEAIGYPICAGWLRARGQR